MTQTTRDFHFGEGVELKGTVYLASPYTSPKAEVRERRFQAITKIAADLISMDLIVFCPITMTHPIDIELAEKGATLGSDFWIRFDEAFMDKCDVLLIARLPGWKLSKGIAFETEFFKERKLPIYYLDPNSRIISSTSGTTKKAIKQSTAISDRRVNQCQGFA